jgi:hypothetical protein
VPLSAVPPVGGAAPGLPGADPPYVVAFLRHVGCPFAERTMLDLRAAAASGGPVEWVAVSHAQQAQTASWLVALGGAGDVRVVVDDARAVYAAWGLGRTTLGHFMGRRSVVGVARLARQGIRNRHSSGTRWQRAGTFGIDSGGIVRWRHLPASAADLPDVSAARAAAAGATLARP